ncbi:MAG: hypothetical protein JSR73_04130 [Proteobacteria bacterium]|nr:hypothetical protein [Pseudomonadota bacterium]
MLAFESRAHRMGVDGATLQDRHHYHAYAAKVMRRIVIDPARCRADR